MALALSDPTAAAVSSPLPYVCVVVTILNERVCFAIVECESRSTLDNNLRDMLSNRSTPSTAVDITASHSKSEEFRALFMANKFSELYAACSKNDIGCAVVNVPKKSYAMAPTPTSVQKK